MFKIRCVLAVLVVHVGLAHCLPWDILVAEQFQLEFRYNGTVTHTEEMPSNTYIFSMYYDPGHDRVLFLYNHNLTMSIYSFDPSTKKTQPLLTNIYGSEGLAYDPVTELLFTAANRKIYSYSLQPRSNQALQDKPLIATNGYVYSLAVDSCRGYIYWATEKNIERAQFDGSEREVVINNGVDGRIELTIDQQTQSMYWIEYIHKNDESHTFIESANLNGENRRTLYQNGSLIRALTVSKNFIYWKNAFQIEVWQLPKNPPSDGSAEPKLYATSDVNNIYHQYLAAHYTIKEQTRGKKSCKALKNLKPKPSDPDSTVVSTLCVHGTEVTEESRCECTQGYTGERCDVSICQNYCLHGDCSISAEGQPECRCNAGYSGQRCEVNACNKHCLNNGVCSLNEEGEAVCQCTAGYEGERCDVSTYLIKCFQTVSMLKDILNTDIASVTLSKGVTSSCASTVV